MRAWVDGGGDVWDVVRRRLVPEGRMRAPASAYEAAVTSPKDLRGDGELVEGDGSWDVCQLPLSHVPSEVNNQRGTRGRGRHRHMVEWEQRAGGVAAALRNIAEDEVGLLLGRLLGSTHAAAEYCLEA